ncbi:cobalt transporter CbiM [candidate division CSSED10-310 bacterium]|uniref:Cobalt transporter CbiM n=1 Tax=candidate division CSSED10-310 bacterium TaxID=2855610 RepID=A0ABV6YRJ8_UNCC1
MHISEGILGGPVLLTGAVLSMSGIVYGLYKLDHDQVPKVAIVSAALFVASLIHIPLGPANVHLILNGIAGLLLGWTVFPAYLVVLVLHAMLFQFGGLTVLGVNTFNLALPAVLCYYFFKPLVRRTERKSVLFGAGVVIGFFSIGLSIFCLGLSLYSTGPEFLGVAGIIAFSHLPVMVVEGAITGSVIVFLHQVRPDILG